MPEIADRFQRQLEELIRAGKIQGLQLGVLQGRQEGQVLLLRRQIARKFGDDTARRLYELLDDLNSLDDIDWVTDALLKCGTGEEFIEWVRFRDADARALPAGSTAVPGPVRSEWGLVRGRTIWACFWMKEEPKTLTETPDIFGAVWMSCPTGERGRAPGGFCAGWQPADLARRRPRLCPGCLRSCPTRKTSAR